MSVQRVFLNWDRPGLTAAVEYLVERFASSGELDLANLVMVVPGARAGRRLLELLVQLADQPPVALFPAHDRHRGEAARAALSGQTPVC